MKANEPLRIGIAGLGTVGSGLLQLLARHGAAIAEKCGRRNRHWCAKSRESLPPTSAPG
jgi:homoserine dehydrogenase